MPRPPDAPLTIHTDRDADRSLLSGKRVAIIGYGNQGHAHALNLHDEGIDVVVGLRAGSPHRDAARAAGLAIADPVAAAAAADLVVLLAPDETHAAIHAAIAPHLRSGAALCFAHGLSIRFGLVAPRDDIDVILVAPKGPGTALRRNYLAGRGMPALFAVAQDASGAARAIALAYGAALGCGRVAMLETTFAQEAEADLFNEQGVVWGAVPEIIQAGYDTLVEAGFSPEIAYFECVSELKLLADLIDARGIAGMREVISPTAEFAALEGRGRIVTEASRTELRRILAEVRSGAFTRALVAEAEAGYPRMRQTRRSAAEAPIERTGRRLRDIAEP